MYHSTIRILSFSTSLLFGVACLQPLSAATFGDFTYFDAGSEITISSFSYFAGGDISIPPIIDGKPVTAIAEGAFSNCMNIRSLAIPSSVTTIGRAAFSNCIGLSHLTIPTGVSVIEESTFSDCRALTSVTLPGTVNKIGASAFYACRSLKALRIPENVTVIADGLFVYCFSLADVTFPRNLAVIGARAFYGCGKLTAATIPQKVTTLGEEAFAASGLTKIVIPEKVKSIGQKAFYKCLHLRKVEINAGLTGIDDATFAGCKELARVTLPDSMRKIGGWAFQGCALTEIDLKSVNEIEPNAFSYCKRLPAVTVPRSVKTIGDNAFSNCKQLASAVFEGNAPTMGKAVFDNSAPDFQIFVSDGSERFTAPRWHGYRVSLPKEEIAVQLANGNHVLTADHTSKFGMVLEGTRSGPNVFTIRNVGNRKLTGLSARIKGGDSSDFLIRVPMKSSLAPGKRTTIELVFKPKDKGKRASTLQILSSDANENPFEIRLSGVGLRVLK